MKFKNARQRRAVMAKIRGGIINQQGQFVALGYTFSSEQEAKKWMREKKKGSFPYRIRGRDFHNMTEAKRWKENRIRNPPIGQSPDDVRRWAVIEKIPTPKYAYRAECCHPLISKAERARGSCLPCKIGKKSKTIRL